MHKCDRKGSCNLDHILFRISTQEDHNRSFVFCISADVCREKRKERDPDPDRQIGFRIFSKNDLIFNLSLFHRFHGLWPQVCKKTGECQSSDGSGMEAMPPGRSVLFPETEMAVSRQAAASSFRRESRERERRRSWLKKVPKKMSPAPVVSTG